jgi:lipopolysaccharide heptosyltransferase I
VSRSDPPSRVLLVRTSALGDIVHALPVLAALKRALPRVSAGWVVDEAFAPLLEGHGLVDRLFPVPLRRWRRGGAGRLGELARFAAELRAFRADVAIDLMGSHKGALLARLSGAPRRVGARRRDRREPSSAVWINVPVAVAGGHAVDRGLDLLDALGLPREPADFAPGMLACGRDRQVAGAPAFIHPGAAWGNKRYPPDLWGRVAARLAERLSRPVLVGAAPGEEALADAVVAASRGAARRFDAPDLHALAGAIRGASVVLAGDTGAAHLARALGVPVVAVHGPTDPVLHGPYGQPETAVVRRLECSFCHQRMDEPKACLLGVDPAAVADRAESMICV